jgi:hypothetical protein
MLIKDIFHLQFPAANTFSDLKCQLQGFSPLVIGLTAILGQEERSSEYSLRVSVACREGEGGGYKTACQLYASLGRKILQEDRNPWRGDTLWR